MTDTEKLERVITLIRRIHELHPLDDAVYDVREWARTQDVEGETWSGSSWDHPLVVEYSDLVAELNTLVNFPPALP